MGQIDKITNYNMVIEKNIHISLQKTKKVYI